MRILKIKYVGRSVNPAKKDSKRKTIPWKYILPHPKIQVNRIYFSHGFLKS